jgi:hypothetical protein
MYLKASLYIGGWEHSEDKGKYQRILKEVGLPSCSGSPSLDVSVTVAYWRKANAIHAWFVKNVQDGVDECQESYVDREKLKELLDLCEEVLASIETVPARVDVGTEYSGGKATRLTKEGKAVKDPSVAMEKLPSQSGFFFGGTAYDEYYIEDLKETVRQIKPLLSNPALEHVDFIYRASW